MDGLLSLYCVYCSAYGSSTVAINFVNRLTVKFKMRDSISLYKSKLLFITYSEQTLNI